eukprot:CAMPEP_0116890898 /NCGR_PEP_ID=MMETSP0467-20121206/1391_1 /TAXON_ID=283647 /ORGANISM="Mesodinium pulex, Strain SPMC105" /LENGTH=66 /DNA_ID=CAMNT_0004559027 /DNA_START=786 /DNA_END=989 /DNA_ORIENTATION=-
MEVIDENERDFDNLYGPVHNIGLNDDQIFFSNAQGIWSLSCDFENKNFVIFNEHSNKFLNMKQIGM